MGLQTPLYQQHVAAGARIVDFGGWDMPLHYGSQVEEHHAVRRDAGAFDVSHMTIVDLDGAGCRPFLERLLANDINKLTSPGRALYSCMLKEDGGIVDDLITYRVDEAQYRMIVNAATREQDLQWILKQAEHHDVAVRERPELAMIAVQGPHARDRAAALIEESLRADALALAPFSALAAGDLFVARTGYTGEDGWEIVMPAERAGEFWGGLIDAGVAPCGLGARDTLRLEAGMNLYGTDMDLTVSPLESGLAWTVAFEPRERAFIGRDALEEQRQDPALRRFCGLLLEGRGVLRNHQRVVVDDVGDGEVTSGGFSPTLGRSIALARLPAGDYDRARVDVRGKLLDVRLVTPPFVRHGKARIEL